MASAAAVKAAKNNHLFEWEGKDAKGGKQKGLMSSPSAEIGRVGAATEG